VLTEGWNRPEASCLILARPTRSLGLYRQICGRILRPARDKTDALILDHSGAVFMHGFPDDEVAWALHEDKRAENISHAKRSTDSHTPALTTCPECFAVRSEGKPCTQCGWRPVRKPKPVEVADGELGEVDRQRRAAKAKQYNAADRLQFYQQLLWIATKRGYKPGWVSHKYKKKFGEWPPGSWRCAEPLPPSPATQAWVKSSDIAYAKAVQTRR
jgi:superfamily II DNA or RNA helicase